MTSRAFRYSTEAAAVSDFVSLTDSLTISNVTNAQRLQETVILLYYK